MQLFLKPSAGFLLGSSMAAAPGDEQSAAAGHGWGNAGEGFGADDDDDEDTFGGGQDGSCELPSTPAGLFRNVCSTALMHQESFAAGLAPW